MTTLNQIFEASRTTIYGEDEIIDLAAKMLKIKPTAVKKYSDGNKDFFWDISDFFLSSSNYKKIIYKSQKCYHIGDAEQYFYLYRIDGISVVKLENDTDDVFFVAKSDDEKLRLLISVEKNNDSPDVKKLKSLLTSFGVIAELKSKTILTVLLYIGSWATDDYKRFSELCQLSKTQKIFPTNSQIVKGFLVRYKNIHHEHVSEENEENENLLDLKSSITILKQILGKDYPPELDTLNKAIVRDQLIDLQKLHDRHAQSMEDVKKRIDAHKKEHGL